MNESAPRKINREIVRDGRTYKATIEAAADGKVKISLTSNDQPGQTISQIGGVVDPDDFGMFGKIFRPEFAQMVLREDMRSEPSKTEQRR